MGGGRAQSAEKGMKKAIFGYKFNILSFFLMILVLSLIYQIIIGLYGLFSYKHRLQESEQLLREKLSLVETLEAKIQQFDSWTKEPAPDVSPNENDQLHRLPEVDKFIWQERM